jgi:NTE family protein
LKRIPLGVALSGGTAKSIAHIGVLKALVEDGMKIKHIAGTSGGSIMAVLYASGMPISTMEELALEMSWKKLMSIKLSRLGFLSSQKIADFMKELIGDIEFEDLKLPCYIIATNLETGQKKVFNSGNVAVAVRASCSIPQIYLPVEIGGHYFIDGGFSEYLAIETLKENAGKVFAVGSHLAPVYSIYEHPRHILHLIMQLTGIMAKRNYLESEKAADFIIRPNLDEFSAFDFENAATFMNLGYQEAKRNLPRLRREWKRKSSLWGRILDHPPS